MKTLLLMRHAKSSWKDDSLDDHDRPLNKRGKRDAPRMGELLRSENLVPDFVVVSSARRARKTAEQVAFAAGYRGETRITGELYAAGVEKLLQVVRQTPETVTRLLLIAHNPGLEELLELLTDVYSPLTTAAVAHLEVPAPSWQDFSQQMRAPLLRIWQPRELA